MTLFSKSKGDEIKMAIPQVTDKICFDLIEEMLNDTHKFFESIRQRVDTDDPGFKTFLIALDEACKSEDGEDRWSLSALATYELMNRLIASA